MNHPIVVLGDLNLDVLTTVPEPLPADGEVRTAVRVVPGGSAGCFARVAAREGIAVIFIGCVGNDPVGELLIRSLRDEGIDPHVKKVNLPTGAIVSLGQRTGRTILCCRGANDGLDAAWVNEAQFRSARHLHLSGYSLLSSQREAAHRAIEIARSFRMTISLDPPPANLIRAFGVAAFRREIAAVDWLFPNFDEGKALTGEEPPEKVVTALAETFSVGALTLGREGSLAWKGDERDRCEVEEIACTDPTGAGDAFAASFVVAYLAKGSLHAANWKANQVAWSFLRDREKAFNLGRDRLHLIDAKKEKT